MSLESKTDCKLVIVEGNISAGKSTLCRSLANDLGFVLYLEPTVENPFLEPYYKEPKKYALPMQLWLLKQRFVTYVKAVKYCMHNADETRGVILDRSIWSDIVFAEKNFVDGNFSREGYDYYLQLRERMLSSLPAPHALVYLDTSAEVCYDRIHKLRQRGCEGGIPLEYLAGLDECYKNFVTSMQGTKSDCLTVPWNTFGSTEQIASFVRGVKAPPLSSWVANKLALDELLTSPSAVAAAMKMPFTIDEAGADIEVADPDFITSKEIRVMPPSPAERPTRSKREAPLRSPDNVQTKTRRTRASPTSVVVLSMDLDAAE